MESLAIGRVVPTEPTTVYDWIIFGWLVFASSFVIASSVLIMIKRKRYAPLRTTTTANLLMMGTFGIVHGWSAFLSNQHFDMWLPITLVDCSLWTYWIQFGVGLSGWLIALLNRMLSHGFVLNQKMMYAGAFKRFSARAFVFLAVAAPIVGICFWMSRSEATAYDPRMRGCYTPPQWKGLVSAWMVWSLVLLCGLNVAVERGTRKGHMSEYRTVRTIVVLATLTVLVNNFLSFTGLINFSVGRCAYTFLLSFVYLVSFSKLSSYKIYKALRGDKAYERRVLSDFRSCVVVHNSVRDLVRSPQLMEKFLVWCRNQDAGSIPRNRVYGTIASPSDPPFGRGTDPIFFQPTHVVDCYRRVREWKELSRSIGAIESHHEAPSKIDQTVAKSREIVNSHMLAGAAFRLEGFTPEQISYVTSNNTNNDQPNNLFDVVEDRVLYLLQELWGRRWLEDFYSVEAMGLLDRYDVKSSDDDDDATDRDVEWEGTDDDGEGIQLVDMRRQRKIGGEGGGKDASGKTGGLTYYHVPAPNNQGVGAWAPLGGSMGFPADKND